MEAQKDPRFAKSIEEFNQGLYFECHETLEEVWLEEHGEDRRFYQGIIQISAGYFKWEQGVLAGAIKLWRAGLEKVEPYGPVHVGIDLSSFVQGVKYNLRSVEEAHREGRECPLLDVPLLCRLS